MNYNITNHELYELITRFEINDITLINTTDYLNDELSAEIDLIIKHLTKNPQIIVTKDQKVNNDLVYEIILDCYNVNSNLRHLIHKRVNVEDNYYLISCVVKAMLDLKYLKYQKNTLELTSEVIEKAKVYNLASIYHNLEILKTNQYIVLILLYLHNADVNKITNVSIASIIELVYRDIDFLIGEKQSAKSYIQALKKLPNVIDVLGGKIQITSEQIIIEQSFSQNIKFNALTNETSEIEIGYNNIEIDEAYKIYAKITQN